MSTVYSVLVGIASGCVVNQLGIRVGIAYFVTNMLLGLLLIQIEKLVNKNER